MEQIDLVYIEDLLQDSAQFEVTDDRKADWAIEKVLESVAERDRITAIADARIKELQMQKQAVAEKCNSTTQYLTDKLFGYFQTVKPAETKTQKIYKLLSGKLVLKQQQPEYQRDESQMLAWAEQNAPDYIKVAKSVSWADLKKASAVVDDVLVYQGTGEVVPGVVVKARPDVFEVTK